MTKPTNQEVQPNKQHKTLRDKLKKRREELKKHKKQKKIKKQEYDSIAKKEEFFSQKNYNNDHDSQAKQKKIIKYIKRFIDIFEDDLQQFFSIFQVFDQQGQIDIADIENKAVQKCLKKMFKYLPLIKHKMKYEKKAISKLNLDSYMRNKVSQVIVDYMENGSDQGQQLQSSSDQNTSKPIKQVKEVKKQHQKNSHHIVKQQEYQMKMINQKIQQPSIGPFISTEDRLKIAEIFSQQTQRNSSITGQQDQNEEFDRIFSMSSQREKKKKETKVEEVPAHLMAEGSAKLGQKAQVDEDYLEKYNKQHRPKKLIEEHREMMRQGNVHTDKNQRKPFDRQRDIVDGGRHHSLMSNGVFFDFKDRMTKPKNTNNFL